MAAPFFPKQITQYQAAHLAELQGDVSEQAIDYSIQLITPPGFSQGDVVHDNAAGSGAVTQTIMEKLPKGTEITIDATDVNEQFVEGCKALAASHKWPVTAQVMPAQKLLFSDDHFTHSFTSFAFHCLGDHDTAAKEIYRTLKPGGTAVASIWTDMPHVDSLQHAHWRTRGKSGPMPSMLPLEGFQEKDLVKALVAGGFQESNIKCAGKDCFLKIPDLKRWAQLAWSYLGSVPPSESSKSGWTPQDEDKWDEAVDDIVEQLHSGQGISKNEKGETVLKMIACIAIAKK